MPAADLPVACVLKTRRVTAVIRGNVRTKTGVKTENVLFPEKSDIVMSAPENTEKDY